MAALAASARRGAHFALAAAASALLPNDAAPTA